jgi:serine/threonine protein kinase
MKGGELLAHLRKKKLYPEKEACMIIKKLLRAVAYLHKNGIVHRDLKVCKVYGDCIGDSIATLWQPMIIGCHSVAIESPIQSRR